MIKQVHTSLVGKKFGNLTVLSDSGKRNSCGHVFWNCLCICGKQKVKATHTLKAGMSTMSCGCTRYDNIIKHHKERHPLYPTWITMMSRCYRINNNCYANYGGRGIKVDARWHDVNNFISDMEPKPVDTSLDRIDNNGNYSKENCKWSTAGEQGLNKRNNRYLTYKGRTQLLRKWAKELNLKANTVISRIDLYGWSVEKALETPKQFVGKWKR